jgi:diguanylate cyclase (GGDEF)-like protein
MNVGAEERPHRVLVSAADSVVRNAVADCLSELDVREATDAITTAALAVATHPDLVILDATHGEAAAATIDRLRRDFRTSFVPVIFVVDQAPTEPPIKDLIAGGDDYVLHPFEPEELSARVVVTLRRAATLRGLNPLTGLPGNVAIGEEISDRLVDSAKFAFLYADLDNFKAYNDRYGFSRGDEVIKLLADSIVISLEAQTPGECFAGHVGGDDFVVLTSPDIAQSVAERICRRFDERVTDLYDSEDRERGWIEVVDRQGNTATVPICSVSIGIVETRRSFESAAQMAEVAAEVKGIAKREPRSSWARDRRQSNE